MFIFMRRLHRVFFAFFPLAFIEFSEIQKSEQKPNKETEGRKVKITEHSSSPRRSVQEH